MTRRALLIGAQILGLDGVDNDVAAMAETLTARGFDPVRLTGAAASRAGILAAYDELVAQTRRDDVVVVFYSGHGGLLHPPPEASTAGTDLQFILPTDYCDSAPGDFRGITAAELSVQLARLTGLTDNVTAVLDCCHSALMSRQRDLRIKAVDPRIAGAVTYDVVARHLHDRVLPQLDVIGNPHAVRVVACSTEQSAYEQENADSVSMGLLTDALTRVLAQAGDLPVSWSVLIRRIRERVLDRTANQRPEAEGPSRRVPFGDAEAEPVDTLPVVDLGGGRVELPGAPLLGARPGDEFTLESAGAVVTLGVATVSRLTPMSAVATLRLAADPRPPAADPRTVPPAADPRTVPPGARARRSSAVASPLPVRVPPADALLTAVETSTLLRSAEPTDDPAIEVRVVDGGRWVVHDRTGPLHHPVAADAGGVRRIVDNLHNLAQATALRQLEGDPFDHGMTVSWGLVSPDGLATPARAGDMLHVGDHLWFRLRNDGRSTVYVSLLDIGLAGGIAVLNDHLPSGIPVRAGTGHTLGLDERTGRLVGMPVGWPDTLPAVDGRLETIVLIYSDDPIDVSVLRREGARSAGTRYVVDTIDFVVGPCPRPTFPIGKQEASSI